MPGAFLLRNWFQRGSSFTKPVLRRFIRSPSLTLSTTWWTLSLTVDKVMRSVASFFKVVKKR